MRVLGIDFGSKKVGLAKATAGTPAVPLAILVNVNRSQRTLLRQLSALCANEGITEIVVGLPLSLSGDVTDGVAKVRKFSDALQRATGLPVHLQDERLSTKMAQRISRGLRGEDDATAAMLILQGWLDHNRK